jgi:trigger factor
VPVPENMVEQELTWRSQAMERELGQAGMDWDAYFSAAGIEGGREAYDAELRENVEKAVKTQFVLDSIADAREVTVDNEDLSAQIMAAAQRNRVSPEQYAQQLQQGNNIADFVADVRRTKALAQLLEQTTITDQSGNVVDLEALRPRTVAAPAEDAESTDEAAEGAEAVVTDAEAAVDDAEGSTDKA